MKLSVVIPSYNSERLLVKGLKTLANQVLSAADTFEVIVVDDGSTDQTKQAVEQMAPSFAQLHYLHRPRDDQSCRSIARNLGIGHATGDILCFLDSGILVPVDFLSRIAEYYRAKEDGSVLLHYVYGLEVDPELVDMGMLEHLNLQDAADYTKVLTQPYWRDPRHPVFQRSLRLMQSTPWYHGFSCALTVPADRARHIHGFDEAYKGWGAEDIDFCYRLYREGAAFDFIDQLCVFHYPHPLQNATDKYANEARNKRYFHLKYNRLETEMCLVYNNYTFSYLLEKLDALSMERIVEETYPAYYLDLLNEELGKAPAAASCTPFSLLVGVDSIDTAKRVAATHLFAYNERLFAAFRDELPDREVVYLLGCVTPYPDNHFETAIVTDFIRVLRGDIQVRLLEELTRIAKQVVCLVSDRLHPDIDSTYNFHPVPGTGLVGNPLKRGSVMEPVYHSSVEELEEVISRLGRIRLLRIQPLKNCEGER